MSTPASGWYNSGALVWVSAAANPGYQFSGFSADLAGTTTPQPLTMNGPKTVTANFAAQPQYYLTTVVSPSGGGTISPVSGWYNSGTPVTITATPYSGYQFSSFTGTVNSASNPLTVTMSSAMTETANFVATGQYTATTIADLNNCIQNLTQYTTCALAAGTYTVTSTITVNRSNVTVTGGSGDRSQTKLVRDPSFTGPIIQINAPNFTAPGITLQNLTVCGGLDKIRDIHTQSDVNLGASPVGCPRQQTTPGFTSRSCGDMLRRITRSTEPDSPRAQEWNSTTAYNLYDVVTYHNATYTCIQANINRQPDINPAYWTIDFQCSDVVVQRADTLEYQPNPFPSTGDYALTIANVDLEDATGHALSLFEDATPGWRINDIYIHDSAINRSAVTGILYGANNAPTYHTQVCDPNPNWLNDQTIFAPRNLRIENNTFANNNTGAMGGGAVRWVGLRNNTFTNNYIHPQVGNEVGGTIEFDPCADKLEITGNHFYGPSVYEYVTPGLELYSRNVTIQGNTISGYPVEGIALNSVFGATVTGNNQVQNNNTLQYGHTGGIAVSTAESITGPCGDPRESRDVTISDNTVSGQVYGVYLGEHDLHSTATLRRFLNPSAVTLNGSDFYDPVGRDGSVVLDSYSGPIANPVPEDVRDPRALTVVAVSPVTSRCSTGTQPQTFAFPARHPDGGSHIRLIEVVFSISGNDEDGKYGPDSGAAGCHFAYFPQYSPRPVVYLDGPEGGSTWSRGSSVVGPGGSDLNNDYCTIHAGWMPAPMPEPYISPFISNGLLVIEFPPSSTSSLRKHIYTVVQDDQLPQGRVSDGGTWKYWGWWATQ